MFEKIMGRAKKLKPVQQPVEMTVVNEVPVTIVREELITANEEPTEVQERPKVKVWKKQDDIIVDLDPTVSLTLVEIEKEQNALIKQFEQNQITMQRMKGGVLKYFNITTPSIKNVKLINTEGIYQLSVPQPDVQKES